MKFKNPWVSATQRLLTKEAEHALYEKAANDIELNNIHKGIWTKAFSLSEGDEQKQKAKYIELMVEYYKDLILAGEELEDILATEEEKRKKAEAENKKKEYYEKVKAEQKKAEQQKKDQEEVERLERVKHMKAFKKQNQAKWDKERKDNEHIENSQEVPQFKNKKRNPLMVIFIFLIVVFFLSYLANIFQSNQSEFILEKHYSNINWALQNKVRLPAIGPIDNAGIDLFKESHPDIVIEKNDTRPYLPGNFDEAAFRTCLNRYEYIDKSFFSKIRWFYAYKKYRLECLYDWKFYYVRDYSMRNDEFNAQESIAFKNNYSMSQVYRAKDKYYSKQEIKMIDKRINKFFQD